MSETVLKTDKFPTINAALRFFEIALVLVHLDHIASIIVNADHGIM